MPVIKLLKHQKLFLEASTEWVGLVGGFGCGKTDAIIITAITNMKKYKDIGSSKNIHLLLEPTTTMLRDILYPKINYWLEAFGIDYTLKLSHNEYYTKYGILRLRSGENYIRLPGQEVSNSYIDEYDKFATKKDQKEILDYVVARTRSNPKSNQKYIVTTPESGRMMEIMFPFTGDYIVTANKTLIRAKTADNPYLPSNYIEALSDQFDDERLKAYIHGEYINLTKSRAYHKFNDSCIIDTEYEDFGLINISFDFNVDPMTAIIAIERDETDIIIDEFWKNGSNTYEACEYIKDKYLKFYNLKSKDIIVYGDASGSFRSANSNLSNYQIIEKQLKPYAKNMKFKVPASNPAVIDRINIVNASFQKNKVLIHKRCKNLIRDLREVNFSDDGRGINKKQDPELSHISDALGYMLSYKYPLNFKFNSTVYINDRRV